MAVAVKPLVSFTVEKLGTLLTEEAKFLGSVREQVDEMKMELTRMQSFLIDADRSRRGGDASVNNWVVEIRELAYDAENVIATFVVKVAASGGRSRASLCFDFKFLKSCRSRHMVGTQIQGINNKIARLTRSLQTYGVQATTGNVMKPRITYPIMVEDEVVGLQDHLKTVVAHLKDKNHARIISIWGIGGLGKTTFSKKIHCHREVLHYFDHIAWTCVSQQCHPDQVWRDILLQFANSEEEKKMIRELTSNELVSKLHSLQMEKKCLVILDDIWEPEDWNTLCPAFSRFTETGSKIILTTRNKVVVSHADIQCFTYSLPLLKKEDCLELLEKKLSPPGQGFRMSPEMKKLLEELVGHCGGLPLAIVLSGGLLMNDKTLEGWKKVHEDLNHCLNEGTDRHRGVQDVLALSYQDLPYHLKACFLYLSLYPEDYVIEAKLLVQMWIAEGFVSAPPGRGELGTKTMLDVGLTYLDELANRCMVQATMTRSRRRVKSFRLHDLMRNFCLSKAQEENFSEDLGFQRSMVSTSSTPLNTIRRFSVCVKEGKQQEVVSTMIPRGQHQHVRSCFVHLLDGGNGEQSMDDGDHKIYPLFKGFKFLKVFNMIRLGERPRKRELSKDIGKLIHLKYLSFPEVATLPSSLGNLIFLQTLDLRSYLRDGTAFIPDILWKLKELRHLYLPLFYECSTKLCLDGLSKLQTLFNFNTLFSDIGDLATMPNLQRLRILCRVKDMGKIFELPMFRESSILLHRHFTFIIDGDGHETQEEHNLLSQVLACRHVTKMTLFGPVVFGETFLHNLNPMITCIELSGCKLREDPMTVLGKMPNLKVIRLGRSSYIGDEMVCLEQIMRESSTTSIIYFPQLTRLFLHGLDISEFKIEKGAMHCLLFLRISDCKGLKEIPDGLRFITTLEELQVFDVNESLKQRLQQGGKDFSKIQHVPRIIIK